MNSIESAAIANSSSTRLSDWVGKAFIIAYKESTQLLEDALIAERIQCEILRQEHQEEQKDYSPSYLCMLNHRRAWEKATTQSKPTLIVEADFVPVLGFGKCPLPFIPSNRMWELLGYIPVLPKSIALLVRVMQKNFLPQW